MQTKEIYFFNSINDEGKKKNESNIPYVNMLFLSTFFFFLLGE